MISIKEELLDNSFLGSILLLLCSALLFPGISTHLNTYNILRNTNFIFYVNTTSKNILERRLTIGEKNETVSLLSNKFLTKMSCLFNISLRLHECVIIDASFCSFNHPSIHQSLRPNLSVLQSVHCVSRSVGRSCFHQNKTEMVNDSTFSFKHFFFFHSPRCSFLLVLPSSPSHLPPRRSFSSFLLIALYSSPPFLLLPLLESCTVP